MCGIIGMFGNVEKIDTALAVMKNRGKDASSIEQGEDWALGHNLHAIVNHVAQPINKEFVANCEIYNWKDLAEKYTITAENDAHLLYELLKKKGTACLEELDGVFAFIWRKNDEVIAARDILGVKPLWYAEDSSFALASERKVLEAIGFSNVRELHPRKILSYNKKIALTQRPFFTTKEEKGDEKQLEEKLRAAIKKRIPQQKIGLLFSGGVDSTTIAKVLKDENVPFTCYVAGVDEEAADVQWAEKAAKELDLDLKKVIIPQEKIPSYLKTIVPLIEDSNVVKVGVALPFFVACEEAKKDGIKVMFSGLGSEEIFAGYQRHEQSNDINKECVIGLQRMYERDLYRDDVITMFHTIELRLPFLDQDLIKYALTITGKEKINEQGNKVILRKITEHIGVPKDIAWRKKKAAQYGSKFDKALQKLAGKQKKSEYLRQFYPQHNVKVAALISGGKDSLYAAYLMKKMNYELTCLLTLQSENEASYMFHTPNVHLVEKQAELMHLPLLVKTTAGEKEKELAELKDVIKEAKEKYAIEGIVTGALYSTYQRDRIEKIAEDLDVKVFSPLWHIDQEEEMRDLLKEGFEIMFSAIAAEGLDKTWLGRKITEKDVDTLVALNKETGLNIAGEGGEFESLVVSCPLFEKPLNVEGKIHMEDERTGSFVARISEEKRQADR